MKENITLKEMRRDWNYIRNNAGHIPTTRMITLYEKYLHGADSYIFGAEYEGQIVAIPRKNIPIKWCSCKSQYNLGIIPNQELRFRPHKKGSKELANSRKVFTIGNAIETYKLYLNNSAKGYNAGYCFEIALFNYFGVEGWKQDGKPSSKGGDIEVNGEQIQAKFAEATITTTNKLLNEIERRMKRVA